MPESTFRAVRTPGRERPSSTKVMATAGCIPTTTVSASRTRDMAAMFPSILPMKESTISKLEISISTPRASVSLIIFVRSSCRANARRSCMSTWIVTSRYSPIFRIGIFSNQLLLTLLRIWLRLVTHERKASPLQRDFESRSKRGLGGDVLQVNAEMHDGLCDLRAHATDDAICSHEAGGSDGFE